MWTKRNMSFYDRQDGWLRLHAHSYKFASIASNIIVARDCWTVDELKSTDFFLMSRETAMMIDSIHSF